MVSARGEMDINGGHVQAIGVGIFIAIVLKTLQKEKIVEDLIRMSNVDLYIFMAHSVLL